MYTNRLEIRGFMPAMKMTTLFDLEQNVSGENNFANEQNKFIFAIKFEHNQREKQKFCFFKIITYLTITGYQVRLRADTPRIHVYHNL